MAVNANADESAAKTLENIGISMVKGASMRIASEDEVNSAATTGLRFTMQVSKDDYNAVQFDELYESVEWGMLIAPVESVNAAPFNAANVFGENAVYVLNEPTEEEGKYAAINVSETELTLASETKLQIENAENYYVFSGYVHSIKDGNLTRGFVGCGYVKYTVKGEETPQYRFAEYFGGDIENNTRSAYYVAQKYVDDSTVDNAEAQKFVTDNYLQNSVALASATVSVSVDDYKEDITIGGYNSAPTETTEKQVQIGKTLNLNEALDGYTLREDLSKNLAIEPTYARTDLTAERKYESNEFIPFSKKAGAVSLVEEDGETKGAYKYTSTTKGDQGLQFATYMNGTNDKILRGKASSTTGKFLAGYVNMMIRWESASSGGFNLVSLLGDYNNSYNSDWCVSTNWFSGNGSNLGGISFYKATGYKATKITAGNWYKVAFPVYTNYHDGARFGRMYLQLDATSGNNYSEQTVYFKEVVISSEDIYASQIPEAPDPDSYKPFLSTTSAATLDLITEEGDFKYSYKFSYKSTLNSENKVSAANLYFATTTNEWAPKPTNTTIIDANAKFITMEIYFNNVDTINVISRLGSYKVDNFCVSTYWLRLGNTNSTTGVIFYDKEAGTVVSQPENNTWYKVAIQVDRNDANWNGLDMYMAIAAPAAEEVSDVYFKNVAYGGTNIYA